MRVNTGPFQFEGDWTGYFIRGDDVAEIIMGIRYLSSLIRDEKPIPAAFSLLLDRYADDLVNHYNLK